MMKKIYAGFTLLVVALIIMCIYSAKIIHEYQMTSANKSMAELIEELVQVKETKGLDFLISAANAMPKTYALGPECVMRYEVLTDYKVVSGDNAKSGNTVSITIWAYHNDQAAQAQTHSFAQTNYIVANLN